MTDYYNLTRHDIPLLRDPVLVAAFKGWNDASEAASSAVQFLVKEWSAQTVATLDGEEFYVFTDTRPQVRLVNGLYREIDWPSLTVYACVDEALARDAVLLVGHEPQLRWPTFLRATLVLLHQLGVSQAVLLGALLADVPHTRATRLVGSASTDTLRVQLQDMNIGLSRYQGPTGIVGVLQDACGRDGIPAASLWGNVPHYITASPNPQVSLALLQQLGALLDLRLNLQALNGQVRRFRTGVDEAVARSPEATAYVQDLEGRQEDDDGALAERSSPLPSGPEIVSALEEFLRQQRGDDEDG